MAVSSAMACMPQCTEIASSFFKQYINNATVPLLSCLKSSSCSTSSSSNNAATNYYVKFATRKPSSYWRSVMKSAAGDDTASATTETWEGVEDSSVEVAKGPPSLISTLNIEKALRGIAITDVDHYGILGLRRGCGYEQVETAYQSKVKELTSQGLDEGDLRKGLELLKESYRILSTVEERRLYDWSLARNEAPERYVWPFEVDLTQKPVDGTPPIQEPEDVGPTAAVGYFLLAWFILGCILSILLNL